VLSRWHVEGCMNCQNHLEAKATFPLAYDGAHFLAEDAQARGGVEVEVRTHTGLYGGAPRRAVRAGLALEAAEADAPFKVEIR
jgi:tyrosinase